MNRETLASARSINGKEIRLTFRQWAHIIESHDYMAGNLERIMETVGAPDCAVNGIRGEVITLRHYEKTNISEKHCVVVYKEDDGFVITAFFTSRPETITKRGVLWKRD